MKWVGITGSWRKSCPELEHDLAREIRAELERGNGIVTGGALGVDYAATAIALDYAPDGSRLKVILPTTLEMYASHYRKRATEGVITPAMAENLIAQLELVHKLNALTVDTQQTEVNQKTYYLRNTEVMKASDAMLAFQVNTSAGTQDTIDKARERGIPVKIFSYTVP